MSKPTEFILSAVRVSMDWIANVIPSFEDGKFPALSIDMQDTMMSIEPTAKEVTGNRFRNSEIHIEGALI